jgi:hypothetical protein
MILVDSSVWIDHIRTPDQILSDLLARDEVLIHPFVVGEIALGTIRGREVFLASLQRLPSATVASDGDVMHLIERHRLFGRGVSYVDAHLLAAARLTPNTALWARDRRLREAASQLGVAAHFTH